MLPIQTKLAFMGLEVTVGEGEETDVGVSVGAGVGVEVGVSLGVGVIAGVSSFSTQPPTPMASVRRSKRSDAIPSFLILFLIFAGRPLQTHLAMPAPA